MSSLKELYEEELQDLWSANDQMAKVVSKMSSKASDKSLAGQALRRPRTASTSIPRCSNPFSMRPVWRSGEHCKGMEGLVEEARKHALDSDLEGAVLDVAIIAQYQRMCHYGMAGFGTAKAFAEALGEDDATQKLDRALDKIYGSDEFMSDLAERSRNLEAV